MQQLIANAISATPKGNGNTFKLYIDSINKLPKNRVRLEKYHNGVWYSFVVHTAALRLDLDAVSIYRGKGYLTLSTRIAVILLGQTGIDVKANNHANMVKVTKHGPSSSLFDAPRSVVLKIVEHNSGAF